jgi:membrane protease subunit (stomatin/prohibitin family)
MEMTTLTNASETNQPSTAVDLAKKAIEIAKKIEAAKVLYEELDAVTRELLVVQGTGATKAQFIGDQAVTVVDNFETANTVFRPAGVRRFEVKIEDKEKFLKRLKKEAK